MQTKEELAKKEIFIAAKKLFQIYGLSKTSMEEIATSMGKSKKYAYYYYKNKEEIFCEMAREEHARILLEVEKSIKLEQTAMGKVRTFFHIRFNEVRRTIALYPMITSEWHGYWPLITQLITTLNTEFTEILEKLLREGVKSGEFKSITAKECHLLAIACTDILLKAETDELEEEGIPSKKERFNVIINAIMRGLK